MKNLLYFIIAITLLPPLANAQQTPRSNSLLPAPPPEYNNPAAKPEYNSLLKGPQPMIFLDSVHIKNNKEPYELWDINPDSIALLSAVKPEAAIKLIPSAIGGIVYIETNSFARKRYQRFFKSKSAAYAQLISSKAGDSNVAYILNDQVLKINVAGELAAINNNGFESLQIISRETLEQQYHVSDKLFGVLIKADLTKNDPPKTTVMFHIR